MAAQKRPVGDMAVDDGGADGDDDDHRLLSALRPHHHRRDLKIDSDGGAASSPLENDEFFNVKLSDISKEVQCPICLGIIRKTRTVMECLHRFCRECIDKSMRLGNNECPACRTHCASRRSLRDDPNYDTLIAILYPDIDKYEEEELAFRDEEKNRNKQIQSSIAQTLQRQTEALGRRNVADKAAGGSVFVRRSRGSHLNTHGQNSYLRVRNRTARVSAASSDDDSDDTNNNEAENFSSSADEPSTQNNVRRPTRWSSHRFSSTTLPDGGNEEGDDVGRTRNNASASPARAELRSWGRGATRSHTRFGSSTASGGKNSKNTRLARLLDHFQNFVGNEFELYVHLTLLPLDKHNTPSLERPHLCCHPTLSMRLLQQFISLQIPLQADDLEILINTTKSSDDNEAGPSHANLVGNVELSKCEASQEDGEMVVLKGEETVAMLVANAASIQRNLVLLYRPKLAT